MTGSEAVATMHDAYVLFGAFLCSVNSNQGTIYDQDWFQKRVNDIVALFPAVLESPPVPLYSESQADELSALGERWPYTAAHTVSTIDEARFQGPMERVQEYVCAHWNTAEMIGVEPQPLESATSEPPVLQQAAEVSRSPNSLLSVPQELAISMTPVAQQHQDITSIAGDTM
ncbi:hypothetical protein HPB52_013368 [Rhipicephalus sanguineus]|uniref:Uncharacterized protein n=1 Tax=Rhipicephalus sanguineus TaxID=34632 RepID=A0A9D4PPS3_RHISA|nr:hypothetical protein HPB52_013368 [Rhipicephalus sanguineus]